MEKGRLKTKETRSKREPENIRAKELWKVDA